MTYTSTYSTLEISESSFNDIKQRLERAGVLKDYFDQDREHGPMILFGTIGLVVDKETRRTLKGCCAYHADGGQPGIACGGTGDKAWFEQFQKGKQ